MPRDASHRAAWWLDVVRGQARGVQPALLRAALRMAELPYAAVMRARNRAFDLGWLNSERVDVPVISVGNITLGGTGKTPLVAWVCRALIERGLRPAIVSRGYGAEAGALNDEALELEQRLPDVPHLQNPRRVEGARLAIEELAAEAIVLDDGFQHRRLRRDLDLVLLDALDPFGLGHVVPRGLLREPLAGLARAQGIVLSRADLVSSERRAEIRAQAACWAPAAIWAEARHAPSELRNFSGEAAPVAALSGEKIAAFCGIGNPAGFQRTLEQCGAQMIAFRTFPDHHRYTRDDVESLRAWARESGVRRVVCTHKDLVKLGIDRLGPASLDALLVTIDFIGPGSQSLEVLLPSAR